MNGDYFTKAKAAKAALEAEIAQNKKRAEWQKKRPKQVAGETTTTKQGASDPFWTGEAFAAPSEYEEPKAVGPVRVGTVSTSSSPLALRAAQQYQKNQAMRVQKLAQLNQAQAQVQAELAPAIEKANSEARIGMQEEIAAKETLKAEYMKSAERLRDLTKAVYESNNVKTRDDVYNAMPQSQKIVMGISAFMDGFRMAQGGPDAARMTNAFEKYYQKQIDQDIKLGEAAQSKAKLGIAAENSIMAAYLKAGASDDEARAATKAYYADMLRNETKRLAAKGAPLAAAAGNIQMAGKLDREALDLTMKAAPRIQIQKDITRTPTAPKSFMGQRIQRPGLQTVKRLPDGRLVKVNPTIKETYEKYKRLPPHVAAKKLDLKVLTGDKTGLEVAAANEAGLDYVQGMTQWTKAAKQFTTGGLAKAFTADIKQALRNLFLSDAKGNPTEEALEAMRTIKKEGSPRLARVMQNMQNAYMGITRAQLKAQGEKRFSNQDVKYAYALPNTGDLLKWTSKDVTNFHIGQLKKNAQAIARKNKFWYDQGYYTMPAQDSYENNYNSAVSAGGQ